MVIEIRSLDGIAVAADVGVLSGSNLDRDDSARGERDQPFVDGGGADRRIVGVDISPVNRRLVPVGGASKSVLLTVLAAILARAESPRNQEYFVARRGHVVFRGGPV